MIRLTPEEMSRAEKAYPGILNNIRHYDMLPIPHCPSCDSDDTAIVQAGIIGRTIALAAATSKVKLLPSPHPADSTYFCNHCSSFFSKPKGGHSCPPQYQR